MFVVFPWQRSAKPMQSFLDTTQTFPGDVWQEAEATLQVEQTWELLADADAVVQTELSQVCLLDGLHPSPHELTIVCHGGNVVKGRVIEAGSDFIALTNCDGQEIAIPTGVIVRVSGLVTRSLAVEPALHSLGARSLRMWLRESLRHEIDCSTVDSWKLRGKILHVGKDFVRLADRENQICDIAVQAIATIRR